MTYLSEVMADGPVGYWRLGEASGTVAADSSGNGRSGAYEGGPTLGVGGLAYGDPDTAVGFDGVDDRVLIPPAGLGVGATGSFSVTAIIEPTVITGPMSIAARHASGSIIFDFLLSDGTMVFNTYYSGWHTLTGPTLDPAVKHHVALTYDATPHAKRIYLDGAEVAYHDGDGLEAWDPPLTIGANGVGTGGSWFHGLIDEVAYYDTLLSGDRIAAQSHAALVPALSGSRRVRALTVDCSGGAPVVTSTALRGTNRGRYAYSSAGTPAPVRVPGTDYALVAAYSKAVQVWRVSDGSLVSETDLPGDPMGLWPDPDDSARALVPCWGNSGASYPDHIFPADANTVAEILGVGTATPTMTVREFIYDHAQNVVGSTDPFVASPGLISIDAQPTVADATAKTSVEGTDYQTSQITVIEDEDDFSYWDTVSAGPVGPSVSVSVADGQTTADDASSDNEDFNVRLRAFFVDHRGTTPAAHIIDVPLKEITPVTDGVPPQVDPLSQGSYGMGVDPVNGRTLIGATYVSNDFAPEPWKESRFSVVASVVKHPTFGPFAGTPPPPPYESVVDHWLTGVAEGFYDLSTTDGGNTVHLAGPVADDADHTRVGTGPLRLGSVDDATSYLQVHHLQDTDPQLVLDGAGARMPAWEPSGGEGPVADLFVDARVWADSTGYGGASTFSGEVWAYDLGDPTWPGGKVGYPGSGWPSSTWATVVSNSGVFYRERRTPILAALKRGDLLLVAIAGTAYYGDVNARVSSIRMRVSTLAP